MPFLVLLLVFFGLVTIFVATLRPFWGLMLVVVVNQFDSLVPLPKNLTIGRFIGVAVALGWMLVVTTRRQSQILLHRDVNVALFFFVAVIVSATATGANPEAGVPGVLRLAMLAFLTLLVQDFVRTRRQLHILLLTVALATGLSALIGIAQYEAAETGAEAFGNMTPYRDTFRVAGVLENPNAYAGMVMAGIPFSYFLSRTAGRAWARLLFAILVIAGAFTVALTISRAHLVNLLAFVAAMWLLGGRRSPMRPRGVAVAVALVAVSATFLILLPEAFFVRLADTNDHSTELRRMLYYKAVAILQSHPLLGVGLNNFQHTHVPGFEDAYGMASHDLFTFLAGTAGILGIVSFALLVGILMRNLFVAMNLDAVREDPYLKLLSRVILAALVGLVAASVGSDMANQRIFWIYAALATVLSKLGHYPWLRAPGAVSRPAPGPMRVPAEMRSP